jgi:hypothetical protein
MSSNPIIVTFKLFRGRDDDLIKFLKSIGSREKSAYIRLAIRSQFVSKIDSNMACMSSLPDMAAQRDEVSVATGPKRTVLSDEDLETKLSRW